MVMYHSFDQKYIFTVGTLIDAESTKNDFNQMLYSAKEEEEKTDENRRWWSFMFCEKILKTVICYWIIDQSDLAIIKSFFNVQAIKFLIIIDVKNVRIY